MVEIGNIVSYREGEQKRGYIRSCRRWGLPRTEKFAEKTDPTAYGVGIVLSIVRCNDVNQLNRWAYKCVITLDTKSSIDFAQVYWCGNSVMEYVDPVFLDVIRQTAVSWKCPRCGWEDPSQQPVCVYCGRPTRIR